jgi:uncharacterized protein YjbI with pentapeptide repeats
MVWAALARGQIYRWDNGALISGTGQISVGPGVNLTGLALKHAQLSNANLNTAILASDNVTGAKFSGANVKGANFDGVTGFTFSQIYSTVSFQRNNLSGIGLADDDLTGWILASQNMANADFTGSNLTGVPFGGDGTFGIITSVGAFDLTPPANLTGADFSHADLSGASLYGCTLTGATFTGAVLKATSFDNAVGFTFSQLQSTASYQTKNLAYAGLGGLSLEGGNFADQNLSGSSFSTISVLDNGGYTNIRGSSLAGANFTGANLTNAVFEGALLTNANFSGARVKGDDFGGAIDLTFSQMASTASYQKGNLRDVSFENEDLTGWNLSGQDLSNGNFSGTLANTMHNDISSGMEILPVGVGSTTNLTDADLSNANLTGANLSVATLTGANLTGTIVHKANLSDAIGLAFGQIASTADYQRKNLSGLYLNGDNMTGWNFSGQNLSGCEIASSTLTNANFQGAIFHGTFFGASTFAGGNFSDSDLRGAILWSGKNDISTNAIHPLGGIHGLDLRNGETLAITNDPMPITVLTSARLRPASNLDLLLEPDWTSFIRFGPGVTPSPGGNLDLNFAAGTDPSTFVGDTFHLFDWGNPPQYFDHFTSVISQPGYTFDLSDLYSSGDVTLVSAGGDATSSAPALATPSFSAVPEPAGVGVLALWGAGLLFRKRSK